MTDRVLTPEEVQGMSGSGYGYALAKSHERLRAERDLLRAESLATRAYDATLMQRPDLDRMVEVASRFNAARADVDAFDKEEK